MILKLAIDSAITVKNVTVYTMFQLDIFSFNFSEKYYEKNRRNHYVRHFIEIEKWQNFIVIRRIEIFSLNEKFIITH